MTSLYSILTIIHLVGLSIAVGAASVKIVLLIKCKINYDFIKIYQKVIKPITQNIILGLILLTLSGIVWLIDGYPFSSELIIKIIIVFVIWIIGPVIDNVVEPKFIRLAPETQQQASREFAAILNKYLTLEIIATGLFYTVIIIWILAIT